jgi:hypothetical protein
MSHTKDKWVIVFLIYADFRKNIKDFRDGALAMTDQMKAELNVMLKDILTVPLDSSRARMYVLMNSIDYKEETGTKTEAKTLFYEIGNPHNLKYNQITNCEVIRNDEGTVDNPDPGNPVQNPSFLKTILTQKRIHVNEDEDIFFITWDHGSAFGIFREIDPGIAEIRKPIHYGLERYPYLAEFWDKALEKDIDLKKLVDRQISVGLPDIVQIGNTLFSVKALHTEMNLVAHPKLATQTALPVTLNNSSNTQNLLLTFDTHTNAFEVLDADLLNKEVNPKAAIAELSTMNVREILSNDELAAVFKSWLGTDKKVSVLLMMNCWMMNLHTMYSFRETVKCLVAPQGDIGTPGYNYKDILNYLFKPTSLFVAPEELAITCVTTSDNKRMRKRSKKLRADHSDMVDSWKIFAIDLQREGDNGLVLEDHLKKLNEIIGHLQLQSEDQPEGPRNEEVISLYKSMRLVSHDFSGAESCFIIDIINWLTILADVCIKNLEDTPIEIDTLADIKRLINDIQSDSIEKKLVLAASGGKNIYNSDIAIVCLPPTGYGLFFPNTVSRNQNLIDNVRKDFLLNTPFFKWKDFIKFIYPNKIWEPFFGNPE